MTQNKINTKVNNIPNGELSSLFCMEMFLENSANPYLVGFNVLVMSSRDYCFA